MALDLRQNFIFAQISSEQIYRISPNFIYASILTGSSLGLLVFIFCLFKKRFMALDLCQNFVSAQYLENKWTDFDHTIHNCIDKIYVWIVSCHFCKFVTELLPLIDVRI